MTTAMASPPTLSARPAPVPAQPDPEVRERPSRRRFTAAYKLRISPARPNRRRLKGRTATQEDIDAALSVAGAWKDWMDPEEFKRERRELQVQDRPDRQI